MEERVGREVKLLTSLRALALALGGRGEGGGEQYVLITLFVGVNVVRHILLSRMYMSNIFCVKPFTISTCNHGRYVAAKHSKTEIEEIARHVLRKVMLNPIET